MGVVRGFFRMPIGIKALPLCINAGKCVEAELHSLLGVLYQPLRWAQIPTDTFF